MRPSAASRFGWFAGLVATTLSQAASAEPAEASSSSEGAQARPATLAETPPLVERRLQNAYIQYGVAFAVENVADAGPICDPTAVPCILGSGGGIVARLGKRLASPWYFGGAYAFSKQNSSNLYRLAILQQARFEARRYFDTGLDLEPFAVGSVGAVAYGNEWAIDTGGPAASLGAGVEFQITRRAVVCLMASYRAAYLTAFVDSARTARASGLAHFFALEFALEGRDPI